MKNHVALINFCQRTLFRNSLVFILLKLKVAYTKTFFQPHNIGMKTFYETFLVKLTIFIMSRTIQNYAKLKSNEFSTCGITKYQH